MRRLGGRSNVFAALLATTACAVDERMLEPRACAAPVVVRSAIAANAHNVLSAVVTAGVMNADSVVVRFGELGAPLDGITPAVRVQADSASSPVLGLHASTAYSMHVVAFNGCASVRGEDIAFTTQALPTDVPAYRASGSDPSPGYVVFAAGNYGLVIDNTGRVVWYRRFAEGVGLNFQPQPNGHYVARPNAASQSELAWVEVDPLGNVTRQLGCARGLQPRMHDLIAEPDGSYWLLCDEIRTLNLSAQGRSDAARVLGTAIQRRSATGAVIFEWSPFEHLKIELGILDPMDFATSVINWTHGNSLDLDHDGNLLVSFRNLNQIVKIDARTGAVIWRMGGVGSQLSFTNVEGLPFARQHGVRATNRDRLVVLDNLGEPGQSRAEVYEYDEYYGTARLVSAFVSPVGVIARLGGNTQGLAGGRVLASYGNGGAVEEYDASGKVVWRLEGNPGYVFRAQRIRSLYHPGRGDPR